MTELISYELTEKEKEWSMAFGMVVAGSIFYLFFSPLTAQAGFPNLSTWLGIGLMVIGSFMAIVLAIEGLRESKGKRD